MAIIQLTQGKVAIISDEDLHIVNSHKWWAVNNKTCFYAATKINGVRVFMHRLLMGLSPKDGKIIDHIDGDGLNNTRVNMRHATVEINMRNRKINRNNRSGKSGVFFHSTHGVAGAWIATARIDGKTKSKKFGCYRVGKDVAKSLADNWRNAHEENYKITVREGASK